MCSVLDYKELKDLMENTSHKIVEVYKYIEEILDTDKAIKVYGKNIFKKVTEQEVYFITSNKIINVIIQPFTIKTYNIQDIKNIEIEKPNKYEIILRIYTEDKCIIELNNKKDSEDDWENQYLKYISDIANYLVNL